MTELPEPIKKLRALLTERKVSQSKVARDIRVSRQHLNLFLQGRIRKINDCTALKMYDALHVPENFRRELDEYRYLRRPRGSSQKLLLAGVSNYKWFDEVWMIYPRYSFLAENLDLSSAVAGAIRKGTRYVLWHSNEEELSDAIERIERPASKLEGCIVGVKGPEFLACLPGRLSEILDEQIWQPIL